MYTNLVNVYYTCKKEEEKKTNVHTPRPHKENCTKNETVKCCSYIRHNYKCGVEKKTYAIITKKMDIITKLFREKYF